MGIAIRNGVETGILMYHVSRRLFEPAAAGPGGRQFIATHVISIYYSDQLTRGVIVKKEEASAGSGGTATKRTRRWWEPVIADCGCEYKLGERLRSQLSMKTVNPVFLFPRRIPLLDFCRAAASRWRIERGQRV